MSDSEAPRVPGDRYLLEELIAEGPVVRFWRGRDLKLTRPVTIRTLRPEFASRADFAARFESESLAMAKMEHEGLVRVLDRVGTGGDMAVITEPVLGETLRGVLRESGPLLPSEGLSVMGEVASALAAAHSEGLIHRNPTLDGVARTEDGRWVVTDLGTGGVGPAVITPPEISGPGPEADTRTDVFAMGVMAHELMAGTPPSVEAGRIELSPNLPPAVVAAVQGALEPDPDRRWRDAAAFGEVLRTLPPTETIESPRRGFISRERAWLLPVTVVVAMAAVLIGVAALLRSTEVGRTIIDNAREAVGFEPNPAPTTTEPLPTAVADRPTTTVPGVAIVGITDFDPYGDLSEHPERTALVNDGDPGRGWRTERYNSSDFGGLKDGVGLIVELSEPVSLRTVTVRSPKRGWSFELYVSDTSPADTIDWGEPVATATDVDPVTALELDGPTARSVLLWITDLGEGPEYRVIITDIEVGGHPVEIR